MNSNTEALLSNPPVIFSNKMGFILSCAGSAVGMGNIWLFPYRLGQYGGAAFLIPYILFIILFSFVGLSGEFALGRLTRTGPIGAFEWIFKQKGKKGGTFLGLIPLVGTMGVAIGYAIIIGWVFRTCIGFATGTIFQMDSTVYFSQATSNFGSIFWHFAVVAITMIILFKGVTKGIERCNKILMPIFFLLFIFVACYVFFLPNALEGYQYLLFPRWEYLFRIDTWVMAMGQAFFSLSISGSGMVICGSYLNKKENIKHLAALTGLLDTIAALIAGFAIIPAVYAFGMDTMSGPPLLFITLPKVFEQMSYGGILGFLFFTAVFFAGLTSLITLFEVSVEAGMKKLHLKRYQSVFLIGSVAFFCGIFFESESSVGKLMDIITVYIVPFAALLCSFMIFWVLGTKEIEKELNTGAQKKIGKVYCFTAKYIYVFLAFAVFVLGILYGGIG